MNGKSRACGLKVAGGLVALLLAGCVVQTGPTMMKLEPPPGPPLFRLGNVNERLSGTWAKAGGVGVREPLMTLLRQQEAAALFSNAPSNLTLQLDLVYDHENDQPRLMGVGFLSMLTLGLVPLPYDSVWNMDCIASVLKNDGAPVTKYPTRIPSLRYAAADARAFADWLTAPEGGGYAPACVKVLLDQDATSQNMREALYNWLKQAIAEDVVTIYFSGHGSAESPDTPQNLFLLPYDTRYDRIATSSFPMWDVETALKRFVKARKVVVIADACHAGGIGQSFDIARRDNRGVMINPVSGKFDPALRIGR